MRTLKDRLNSLYGQAEESQPEPQENKSDIRRNLERMFDDKDKIFPKTELEKKEFQPIEELVPGQWINTSFGDIFRGEFHYSLDELYGNISLRNIFDFSPETLQKTFRLTDPHDIESVLFIDTETTGLAGGSGTLAFMIGLGWVRGNEFIVHQYFISQMNHEEGMLDYIGEIAQNFSCLASYNGKSYDIPLLNTRYVMNRLQPVFENMVHIDLLHQARALWKYSLTNCKLKTLEMELMDLYRDDDIPGELIPEVYFEYLEAGITDRLERVFYHNRFDIITMLGAMLLIAQSIHNQTPEEDPLRDYAKGRFFYKQQAIERSINHYKNVLDSEISRSRRITTLMELAAIYKKEKDYNSAVQLWEKVVALDYSFNALEELAKYYEHKVKNFTHALSYAHDADKGLADYRQKEKKAIAKRIARLEQKIGKQRITE